LLILSIESSCDETAAAVTYKREIRSNIVASQVEIHKLYGGVVPEIASRAHTEAVSRVTYQALEQAGVTMADIDAVAVTNTPGLIGALLVGVNFAKSLAYAQRKSLIPVNHIRGHVAANYFVHADLEPPFTAFVISGGHTSIIDVRSYTDFVTIGRTRDDAMGEAFDKIARVMGLSYPGGAEMDRLAVNGNADAVKFPSAAINDGTLDMSFSGIKTAVVNYLHNKEQKGEPYSKEDIAASFTKTAVESCVKKLAMIPSVTKLVIAGGVAANSHLRRRLTEYTNENNIKLYIPPLYLCGDNAAMIGAQAYYETVTAGTDLNAKA
jgi:putative glycoprotease GCP